MNSNSRQAPFSRRVVASILDTFFLGFGLGVIRLAFVIIGILVGWAFVQGGTEPGLSNNYVLGRMGSAFAGFTVLSALITLASMFFIVCYFFSEVRMGRSLGKRALSLRIVKENGGAASKDQLMKRFFIKFGGILIPIVWYALEMLMQTISSQPFSSDIPFVIARIWIFVIIAGFFCALGSEGQALHDICAETKVFFLESE